MIKRLKYFFALLVLVISLIPASKSYAKPLDEILDYEITISVNEDATLEMLYHIKWKVLDSDSEGPLTWVKIGIPNNNCIFIDPVSNNIDHAGKMTENNKTYARIDFDKKYYADDVCDFEFRLTQDYMYEMNILKEGETVYYFIPGWFDDIAVDNITVKWNTDKVLSHSHGATQEGDFLVWNTSLAPGEKMEEISVTYNTSDFAFSEEKTRDFADDYDNGSSSYDYNYSSDDDDIGETIYGFAGLAFIIFIFVKLGKTINYTSKGGFKSGSTETKRVVKRTLIKYYPTCPGCGAVRPENSEKCEYCGRSFIESEEVIEEKEIKDPQKYNNEGVYHYGDSPNTYVRVHVTHVSVPRPRPSCAHSSCAHSSCACAHSCACACACACAGGGRAGCSTKDFYNTNLKLSQLLRKKKNK
ncbi:MAG: zinc ribbon domain-containing protein [Lachnospiraceae bacterium]|nr:zinc ribbon domain-containing protein [Lachnospiraceae bacterium]